MATLTAYQAFDLSGFDLSALVTNGTDQSFDDNIYQVINGKTYQDIAGFEYFDAGYHTAYFGGSGFGFTADGTVTKGTVTGVAQFSGRIGDLSQPEFLLQGIKVSAVTLAGVAQTVSTSDDAALLVQVLAGNDRFNLSEFNDFANGLGGSDRLYGFGGSDILGGGDGDDFLYGGDGDDTLVGGAGADTLNGGAGVDVAVYAAATAGVRVDLRSTAAQDTVGAGIDTLTGVENLTGSAFADTLTGDRRANTLNGGAGADVLVGNEGNDTLIGAAGRDTLTGGIGRDNFVLTSKLKADFDIITDFSHDERDHIALSKAVFTGLAEAPGTYISKAEFWAAAGANAAHDASDRVIYDTTSGRLYYDADGTGTAFTAVQIATLGTDTHPALYYSDIFVA